jgi:hypothetical protein
MLDRVKLERDLRLLFSTPKSVRSLADAENRWADAYTSYAADAEDVSGDALASSNPIGFRRALRFRASSTADSFAQQIAAGFSAYWTGASFNVGLITAGTAGCPNVGGTGLFSSETTSLVTAVASPIMRGKVRAALSSFTRTTSASQKAAELATAIHSATTRAVVVTIVGLDTTPAPSGPLAVTNVCTVF